MLVDLAGDRPRPRLELGWCVREHEPAEGLQHIGPFERLGVLACRPRVHGDAVDLEIDQLEDVGVVELDDIGTCADEMMVRRCGRAVCLEDRGDEVFIGRVSSLRAERSSIEYLTGDSGSPDASSVCLVDGGSELTDIDLPIGKPFFDELRDRVIARHVPHVGDGAGGRSDWYAIDTDDVRVGNRSPVGYDTLEREPTRRRDFYELVSTERPGPVHPCRRAIRNT
jgi:hypothetical protein